MELLFLPWQFDWNSQPLEVSTEYSLHKPGAASSPPPHSPPLKSRRVTSEVPALVEFGVKEVQYAGETGPSHAL